MANLMNLATDMMNMMSTNAFRSEFAEFVIMHQTSGIPREASFAWPLACDDVIHHVLVFLPNKKKKPIPLTNIRSVRDIRRVLNDYSLHPESEWLRESMEKEIECVACAEELKENHGYGRMKDFPAVNRFFMPGNEGKLVYTGWHLGIPRQEDQHWYFPHVLGT
jgi:hypothetical protein